MNNGRYILKDKQPVQCDDLMEWAAWFEGTKNRIVAQTEVADGVAVSTVFLGLDHQFGSGPPLLFETMVFGGPLDEDQERYSTWAAAERGHAATVGRVRAVQGGR